MHRIAPSRVLRFIASIPVIVLLTPLSQALPQQKPAPPSPNSQAQLEARVKDLETRLHAAEQKAASAEMEKDYITRVQKQYEAYYEKAFNTQILTLTILGIVIGLVGKFGLDRVVQHKLSEASAQLRTEFTQLLTKETQELREANADRLKTLEEGLQAQIAKEVAHLEARSVCAFYYSQGLSFAVADEYAKAREYFRCALEVYVKSRESFRQRTDIPALTDIFRAIQHGNPQNFLDEAKKELADPLYNELDPALNAAAIDLAWLRPLLLERKQARK